MQLRKFRNNLKSSLVCRVKKNIREQYDIPDAKDESEAQIDFLLNKNQYFCKYQ